MSAIEELITELAGCRGSAARRLNASPFICSSNLRTGRRLAAALVAVSERVRPCEECGNLTEEQPCAICRDPRRDAGAAVRRRGGLHGGGGRRSTDFRGRYHVLGGRLSPLDGVGPEALRLDVSCSGSGTAGCAR